MKSGKKEANDSMGSGGKRGCKTWIKSKGESSGNKSSRCHRYGKNRMGKRWKKFPTPVEPSRSVTLPTSLKAGSVTAECHKLMVGEMRFSTVGDGVKSDRGLTEGGQNMWDYFLFRI